MTRVYEFDKAPLIDLDTLHGRTLVMRVQREAGCVILAGIDHKTKEVFVLSIEADAQTAKPGGDGE